VVVETRKPNPSSQLIMAGFISDKARQVIPRWRTLRETLRRRELDSVVPSRAYQTGAPDFLAQKLVDWKQHQTVGHAADLVGAGVALGREGEVTGAARFLLRNDVYATSWARELAVHALDTPDNGKIVAPTSEVMGESYLHGQVRNLRQQLHGEPRDPILWVELSRVYAILGLGEQAGRCMSIALQLATTNRFVLRSACRLFVHLGDPERAHGILARSDRTLHDPWLLAAEIAVGSIAEKRPKRIKPARGMLSGGKFASSHISELASALATLELGSGSLRKSKKLFKLSLADPTENSIAQVAWTSWREKSIRLREHDLLHFNAFEAQSWVSFQTGDWKQSIEQCKLWQFDQPFSSWPSIFGSFIAAIVLEDYQTSEWFAKTGLRANPTDFMLLNNLAFARVNLGNMEGASEALTRAYRSQVSERENAAIQATRGFLEFQNGNLEVGRRLYLDALTAAQKLERQDILLFALTSVYLAMELIMRAGEEGGTELDRAFQALKQGRDPIFRVLENRLTKFTTGSK